MPINQGVSRQLLRLHDRFPPSEVLPPIVMPIGLPEIDPGIVYPLGSAQLRIVDLVGEPDPSTVIGVPRRFVVLDTAS